jgi:integrase
MFECMETPEALRQRVRREQQPIARLRLAATRLAGADRERIWAIVAAKGAGLSIRRYVRFAAHRCPSLAAIQVTPHVVRHTCAMMILQAMGDLRKVSLWLGHADMPTTEVYLRADPTDTMEAIEAIIPRPYARAIDGSGYVDRLMTRRMMMASDRGLAGTQHGLRAP